MPVGRIPSTMAREGTVQAQWHHADATGLILGRFATRIATVLMGKHKPTYTPHVDTGDFIVVTNVDKLKVTGQKMEQKTYTRYSNYPGGFKAETLESLFARQPERVLHMAVRRMLPKSALGRKMLQKLKLYRGEEHPHAAQRPIDWAF